MYENLKQDRKIIQLDNTGKNRRFVPAKWNCARCSGRLGNIVAIREGELHRTVDRGEVFLKNGNGDFIMRPGTKWASAPALHAILPEYSEAQEESTQEETLPSREPPTPLCRFDRKQIRGPRAFAAKLLAQPWLCAQVPHMYQVEVLLDALMRDALVVLPTGTGKTLVAAYLAAWLHPLNRGKACVFVVDRVPLVAQQAHYMEEQTGLPAWALSGQSSSRDAERALAEAFTRGEVGVLVLTAGLLVNLLEKRVCRWNDFYLCVLDEAHHTSGSHPYARAVRSLHAEPAPFRPQLLALTASPLPTQGTKAPRTSLLYGLGLSLYGGTDIQLMEFENTLRAPLASPPSDRLFALASETDTQFFPVMPTGQEQRLVSLVLAALATASESLRETVGHPVTNLRHFINMVNFAHKRSETNTAEWRCLRHVRFLLAVLEALQVIGSCAALALARRQLSRLISLNAHHPDAASRSLALQALVEGLACTSEAESISCRCRAATEELINAVEQAQTQAHGSNGDLGQLRILVFVQRRKTARWLCDILGADRRLAPLRPAPIVGTAEMNQETQEDLLAEFRAGQRRLLVATSVVEEGLDVPECSLVVRFDPACGVASLIQSRGRARQKLSRFLLIGEPDALTQCRALMDREAALQGAIQRRAIAARARDSAELQQWKDAVFHELAPRLDKERKKRLRSGNPTKARADPSVHVTLANITSARASEDELFGFFSRFAQVPYIHVEGENRPEAIQNRPYSSVALELRPKWAALTASRSSEQFFFREVLPRCLCGAAERWAAPVWLQWHFPPHRKEESTAYQAQCQASLGCFLAADQYWEQSSLGQAQVVLDPDTRMLLIQPVVHDCPTVEFHLRLIDRFALVHVDTHPDTGAPERVCVYLPLVHPPALYTEAEEERVRVANACYACDVCCLAIPVDQPQAPNLNLVSVFKSLGQGSQEQEQEQDPKPEVTPYHTLITGLLAPLSQTAMVAFAQVQSKLDPGFPLADEPLPAHEAIPQDDADLSFAWAVARSSVCRPLPSELWHRLCSVAREGTQRHSVAWASQRLQRILYTLAERLAQDRFADPCECVEDLAEHAKALLSISFLDDDDADDTAQQSKQERTAKRIRATRKRVDAALAKARSRSQSQSQPSEALSLVKRCVVTPTRVVAVAPQEIVSNRITREFGSSRFLIVQFSEEDLRRKLSAAEGSLASVCRRLLDVYRHGLLNTPQYEFLAASSSQMREHKCWFVAVDPRGEQPDAAAIRAWMGDFGEICVVAKYAARLGQAFSSTHPTVQVTDHEMCMIPDIERDGFCFSDGIGTISPKLCRRVCKALGTHLPPSPFPPSALQIRMGGFKGVVAVSPSSQGDLCIRPSMKKFASGHNRLEVINVARAIPAYLNRQIILLLSARGVPDQYILDLQENMLFKLSRMFVCEDSALECLASEFPALLPFASLQRAGVPLVQEPFFRGLLALAYQRGLHGLLTKSRIFVPRARILMGVLDETQTLQYGEVFFQLSTSPGVPATQLASFSATSRPRPFFIQGPVVVAKNPCLHPGDVRVLNAVQCPQLAHLVDVLVFPAQGPRPHPNECSGSDLDGDLYFVSWDERLVPPVRDSPPMDYTPPKPQEVTPPIPIHAVHRFLVDYIQSDQLGPVATAHIAIADREEQGAMHPLCIQLAALHSIAVDFPKTGVPAVLPKEARLKALPKFLNRSDKPSFESEHILDRLYQRCRWLGDTSSHLLGSSDQNSTRPWRLTVDPELIVPGLERYAKEAHKTHGAYARKVATAIAHYGLDSEASVFTGIASARATPFATKGQHLGAAAGGLRAHFRRLFFAEFGGEPAPGKGEGEGEEGAVTEEMLLKASAWYQAAYCAPFSDLGGESPRAGSDCRTEEVLSFAWLVGDLLAHLKQRAAASRVPTEPTVENPRPPHVFTEAVSVVCAAQLGKSLRAAFVEAKKELTSEHAERLDLVSALQSKLPEGTVLAPFGSTASLLFDAASDLDLFVSAPGVETLQTGLRVGPREEQIAVLRGLLACLPEESASTLVEGARVPIISLTFRRAQVDLSAEPQGVWKAALLRAYFAQQPLLFPACLLFLVWAKAAQLTGHGGRAVLTSTDLLAAVIAFALRHRWLDLTPIVPTCLASLLQDFPPERKPDDALVELTAKTGWSRAQRTHVAQLLLALLRAGAQEPSALEVFESPFACLGHPSLQPGPLELTTEARARVLDECLTAYHLLARELDFAQLQSLPERHYFLTVGRMTSPLFKTGHHTIEAMLSAIAGVPVRVRRTARGGLAIDFMGPVHSYRRVEERLRVLTGRYNLPRRNRSYMEGVSSLLLLEGCRGEQYVTLADYTGYVNQQHLHEDAHTIVPSAVPDLHSPEATHTADLGSAEHDPANCALFMRAIRQQLGLIAAAHQERRHGKLDFVVRFGSWYAIGCPVSLHPQGHTLDALRDLRLSSQHRPIRAHSYVPLQPTTTQQEQRRPAEPTPEPAPPSQQLPAKRTQQGAFRRREERTKKRPERFVSSFHTHCLPFLPPDPDEALRVFQAFLGTKGYRRVKECEVVSVGIFEPKAFDVQFEPATLRFKKLRLRPLRWHVCNIRRPSPQGAPSTIADARIALASHLTLRTEQAVRTHAPQLARFVTQPLVAYAPARAPKTRRAKRMSVPEPAEGALVVCPEFREHVHIVRHHRAVRLAHPDAPFTVELSRITKHDRHAPATGCFERVVEDLEIELKWQHGPTLLRDLAHHNTLTLAWRLAFLFSDQNALMSRPWPEWMPHEK